MLFGEVPFPIVELEQKRFASIYPYVDFDDPMFLYNPGTDLFEYNSHPDSLPEVWHSTIPVNDAGLFSKFFEKLREYDSDPLQYAKPKVWIEDFTFMKEAYTEEELDHYINQLLFSEAESYRRTNTVFANILKEEYEQDLIQKVTDTKQSMEQRAAQLA